MPVQVCTVTLPIPLLPIWAVRTVQSLSARTTVHCTYTFTSIPPMGRTDCTEPQCLYNGALYLYLTPNNGYINPLTPNDDYSGRTAPLTSKRCILYIYSTNIGT